jgi:16S rRNA G966 N2-methylase RsmD
MNAVSHNQQRHANLGAHLNIRLRHIAELTADPNNARQHSPRQIRQLARSIESFGFNVPVLIDANGKVIAGHGRLLACRHLGWDQVPTITLDHLTQAQATAFMIADNRLTEIATWDDALLAQQFLQLAAVDLDFSLEVTGFDMGEIDLLIDGAQSPVKPDAADEIPAVDKGPPVSALGDLWMLGRHRLLCGDALDRENYATLMNRKRAAVVFTDPPYNVPIDGHVSGSGNVHHREFAMACGEMNRPEFTGFLTRVLGHVATHSVDGALHFVCMDWRHVGELLAAGESTYSQLMNLCVWTKDNGGMGSLYRSQHELIFVWKSGTASHQNHVQLGQFGRYRTNVWKYPGVNSFGRTTDEGNLLALHPTVKPVALIADALLDASSRNEIVLDPFMGSGSTLLAAERVGRIAYGMELDPHYIDIVIQRWQRWTGQTAMRSDGTSFDALAANRGAP